MLLLLLAACDPGFRADLQVVVPESLVAAYTPEDPGLVVIEQDYLDAGNTLGAICGGAMDLQFWLALDELGCGLGGSDVTVSIHPASALDVDFDVAPACGNWAAPLSLAFAGEPDHVAEGRYDEPDDPENARCGGTSWAVVRFDSEE